MIKRILKYSGIVLFLSGFIIWIASITLSKYTLKRETMENLGSGERFEILEKTAKPLYGKIHSSNIRFIANIRDVFEKTNQEIIAQYSLSDDDIETILNNSKNGKITYTQELLRKQLKDPSKLESLIDNTSHLEGREYDPEELRDQLKKEIRNINGSLWYRKGFDDYTRSNLVFTITKASSHGILPDNSNLWLFLSIGLIIIGALFHFIGIYSGLHPGIKNNNIYRNPATSRGWIGIILGTFMILFYVVLYFYPEYLTNWVIMVDPISEFLNGGPASHWFLYGFLYTLAILVMGIRMFYKYRHSSYQLLRTASVMFFQLAFAFIIPEILIALNNPGYDFKNIWPLDYDFFYSYNLDQLSSSGALGWFMLFWGIILIIIAVPVFTYFYGKRWYCSWVCGCGGLAETLGDPFRHLSDKSLKAWKIERWLVHGVLVFAILNTIGVLYTYFSGSYSFIGIPTETVKTSYGFLISSIFAGVVGTGFYPLMGNRVWCRFGCPLAAYIGLVQRFKSRFRITTNGGQCISCGNCSTYCEMGIDVRWYAQRGQNVVRASCVGCGICAAACPRGVLKLENGPQKGRVNG